MIICLEFIKNGFNKKYLVIRKLVVILIFCLCVFLIRVLNLLMVFLVKLWEFVDEYLFMGEKNLMVE